MVGSLQNHAISFIGAIISIVLPSIPILLIISDLSFAEVIQCIYVNKFVVIGVAVINSVISNLNGTNFFLLRENVLPGAIIGASMSFLIVQALSKSH